MKIKFKITVTAPAAQVGAKGEVKEVDDRAANILIAGNYAERADIVSKKKSAMKKAVAKKVARKNGKSTLSAAYADHALKAVSKKKAAKKKVAAKKFVKKKVVKKKVVKKT
ncbi:MAG TPA: hypothetical protein ENH94_04190 [Phycisphaerales bacterium]|nr:hypothetical protein [Phycisphaerales bacterium]